MTSTLPRALLIGLALLGGCAPGETPRASDTLADLALSAPDLRVRIESGEQHRLLLAPDARALELRLGPSAGGRFAVTRTPSRGALAFDREAATTSTLEVPGSADPSAVRLALPASGPEAGLVAIDLRWSGESALELHGATARMPEAPSRPNILFVSVDTLAAGHLSLHGYTRPTSPRLEAFAADAVVFEHATANAPWTLPSYVSQFSGLYPDGLRRRPFDREGTQPTVSYALHDSATTLAELLAANGYRTAAWVDNPWLSPAVGVDQGFERFDDDDARLPGPPSESGLRTIAPEVTDWIAESDPRPFFAFVHCVDVHAPYPVGFFGRPAFEDPNPRAPAGLVPYSTYGGLFGAVAGHVLEPDERPAPGELLDPRPLADRYDEGILRLDGVLGDFLDVLEERGDLDDTIVVISSDHGESVGRHGWYFDHALLYDDTLHVPLVLRLPAEQRTAARIAQGVELVDLYPTLVDLCALSGAPHDLDGTSLVGHFREGLEPPRERPRFASALMFDATSVQLGALKLITADRSLTGPQTLASMERGLTWIAAEVPELFPDGPDLATLLARPRAIEALGAMEPELRALFEGRTSELYHLPSDPAELLNLLAEPPENSTTLAGWISERRAEDALRRQLATLEDAPTASLDTESEALLRSLGYLGGSEE